MRAAQQCNYATCSIEEFIAATSTDHGVRQLKAFVKARIAIDLTRDNVADIRNELVALFCAKSSRSIRDLYVAIKRALCIAESDNGSKGQGRRNYHAAFADVGSAASRNGRTAPRGSDSDSDDAEKAWAAICEGEANDSPASRLIMRETLELIEADKSCADWIEELERLDQRGTKISRQARNKAANKHHAAGLRIAARVERGAWR